MRFFHLLWFNCQFIFAIFLKVSIRLVYLLSCESEAPRSDSSTLRRAFWHPEEEFLFAGKDPDSEPALSAEGQQGIHADHTQTHTRSSNNAEETQTHTHIRQIESVWTWENTCTQWAHTPPPPSSCSLNLDYTRHQGETPPSPDASSSIRLLGDSLTRSGPGWPEVLSDPGLGVQRGPRPRGLLAGLPFLPFRLPLPLLRERLILGRETWAETATAWGQLAEEEKMKN